MDTLLNLRELLLRHFDTALVDTVWEEEGACTVAIISKVMGATVVINRVWGGTSVCVAEETILVFPDIRNVSTLIENRDNQTLTYLDWIISKVKLKCSNLRLGTALDDVLLLRVSEDHIGLMLLLSIVKLSVIHFTLESVENLLSQSLL